MKTVKFFAVSFIITLCAVITSCGDDDDTTNVGNEGGNGSITGTVAKVDVKKAGSLSTLISDDVKFNITDLTISGDINGDDISFIREMAGADMNGDETKGHLSVLNLKDANIVAGGNPYYIKSEIFVYYSKKNTISAYMFSKCNKLTSVTFPDNVTIIGESIFSYDDSESETTKGNPNLTSVVMGDKVTAIQSEAFAGTGIKDIKIPNSITKIGSGAFKGCSKLATIDIPNSVTEIGYGVFSGCAKLTIVDIPSNITDIGGIFSGCTGVTHLTIPNGTTEIVNNAFAGCENLKELKIPDGVIRIGMGAFRNCKNLVSLSIGSGLRYLGDDYMGTYHYDDIFLGCNSLVEFTVSEDNPNFISVDGMLLTKDGRILVACPVARANVNIPNSVTGIGGIYCYDSYYRWYYYPFNSSSLTSATIPAGVGYISGFNFCSQLTEIHIRCTTPPVLREAFIEVNDKCIFYIPRGTLDVYKKTEWSKFRNIVEE